MRIRPRVLGLTLAAMAALTVPAFAGAGIASQYTIEGVEIPEATPESSPAGVLEFSGEVMSIGLDSWVVGDQTFVITTDTEIEHAPQVGDFVEVKAVENPDGSLTALEIELEDDDEAEDHDEGEVHDGEDDDLEDDDAEEGEHEEIEDEDEQDDHDENDSSGSDHEDEHEDGDQGELND